MNSIKFETGVKTFSVNDGAEISYNPTDTNFVERLYDTFLALGEKFEAEKDKKFLDNKELFEYARTQDKEACAAVDDLFGAGTSDALFCGVSSYALADGLPLWTNFLLAVIDTIPEELSNQVKVSKPRVEKYLKKYHH